MLQPVTRGIDAPYVLGCGHRYQQRVVPGVLYTTVPCYARPTPCPIVTWRMAHAPRGVRCSERIIYAMPGTNWAYGGVGSAAAARARRDD
eukprot:3397087-Rhodomonas_salina.3